MRKVLAVILFAIGLSLGSTHAFEYGTPAEAVAMVKRVKAMYEREGAPATFRAIDDPSNRAFHDRDLYPFVYDLDGVNVAHGARPSLVGKNLYAMKDQDGVFLIQDMIRTAKEKGSGWAVYKWPNSITNRIENKLSYFELMGDYFVGVGVSLKASGANLARDKH